MASLTTIKKNKTKHKHRSGGKARKAAPRAEVRKRVAQKIDIL